MQLQRITTHTKNAELKPIWHVIDAEGERLGRLASRVANLLQGKHRANYSRHQNTGDFVIVVNASKVGVTGNKLSQKTYYRHTGYLGHLRTRTLDEMLQKFPERVIEKAVKGMLPHNTLGRQMLSKLKVYAGPEHPHQAQKPEPFEIGQVAQ
jgi:large subunit ribosomal protein L13